VACIDAKASPSISFAIREPIEPRAGRLASGLTFANSPQFHRIYQSSISKWASQIFSSTFFIPDTASAGSIGSNESNVSCVDAESRTRQTRLDNITFLFQAINQLNLELPKIPTARFK
jgi:hypothetical protein